VARLDDLRTLIDARQFLVPCDGSAAAYEALAFACTQAKRSRGRVFVVHVIEVKRTLPLDAEMSAEAQRGENILTEAERIGEELEVRIEGELLQAREAGHAIVDEAIERGIDVIVMGTEYTSPFGEFQIGRTAQFVLKQSPCQVWLFRMPSRGGDGRT
jgi:nucleotide-binding universal stress UspA family protein